MKRIIALFQIALLVVNICSCNEFIYKRGTLGETKYYEAQAVLCAGVPYFMDLKTDADRFDKVKVLDEDLYGRKLYEYICTSKFHWKQIKILIICQKTERNQVFYYEDYCYILSIWEEDVSSSTDCTDEDTRVLKERNDWDKPLDDKKMRCVQYPYDRSANDVDTSQIEVAFRKYKNFCREK